jgi:hypothetical protein
MTTKLSVKRLNFTITEPILSQFKLQIPYCPHELYSVFIKFVTSLSSFRWEKGEPITNETYPITPKCEKLGLRI